METFTTADPGAWLLAEVQDRTVGITLATRWNDGFGWIGVYIVDHVFRGRGIGLSLFRAALDRLEPGVVGLDGDASQRENYRRSGFVDVYGNTRWHGPVGAWRADPPAGTRITGASEVTFEDLVALDARAVGSARPGLLRAWLGQPDAHSVAAVRDEEVVGSATVRPATRGWKVGPLLAPDPGTARALVSEAVVGLAGDTECWLDVPDPNVEAGSLLRDLGYDPTPTSGRMVRGTPPVADPSLLFAILAHEVG